MAAGAYSRLWSTAVARKLPDNPFIEATGHSLRVRLPKGVLPEMEMEWHVPKDNWNAFERNRGRAYCLALTTMVAFANWLAAMNGVNVVDTRASSHFEIPKRWEQLVVGWCGTRA